MADEGSNGAVGEGKAVVFSALKTQLLVSKVGDAVEFLKSAFGAEEVGRIVHLKRKAEQDEPLVVAAEMKIGESVFSVVAADETGDVAVKPNNAGLVLSLETEDVDAAVVKAVGAGAAIVGEVTEKDAAVRVGKVKDPFGFVWVISSPPAAAAAKEEKSVDDEFILCGGDIEATRIVTRCCYWPTVKELKQTAIYEILEPRKQKEMNL
ncbi:hypothetical protein AKJ16_DCAP06993 [Drosera capensis]